ncbi:MAG: MFS transporter [Verrucomicrobiota bacterium]
MPRRFLVVFGTFTLALILYIDRVCISVAKDDVMGDLDLSNEQWGWIMSAFALGYALFQTPSGALADRLGARKVLTVVVTAWSIFTGLTAAAWSFVSMLFMRFLFGAGEAGAFPGMARVTYSWIPVKERGLVKGINFSASRIGGAVAYPLLAIMIAAFGWRLSFSILMILGFVWAVAWWLAFRDEPEHHPAVSPEEKEHILANRQDAGKSKESSGTATPLPFLHMIRSGNLWLMMVQYFCSNFTFFFSLTWLFPYVKDTYGLTLQEAGFYSMIPLLGGAVGNLFSGYLVDLIFRNGKLTLSRRIPAILGFILAATGLLMSIGQTEVIGAVFWLTIAIFGADMTLSPSWSFCIDIGGAHAGKVSGTMNMAGNLGSAMVAIFFGYLLKEEGGPKIFFYTGAVLNVIAIACWLATNPRARISLKDWN